MQLFEKDLRIFTMYLKQSHMRKITEQSVNAFNANKAFKKQNMEVSIVAGSTYLILHGNIIAIKEENGSLFIKNAGWQSNTTKEKLNGLDGVSICQKNFEWYLNGKEWDGKIIEIK